jgi:hypothetical protein
VRGAEETIEERADEKEDAEGEDQNDDRNQDRESDRHAAEKWFHAKSLTAKLLTAPSIGAPYEPIRRGARSLADFREDRKLHISHLAADICRRASN